MSDIFVVGPEELKKHYANPKFVRYDAIGGQGSRSKKGYVLKGMFINGPKVYYRKTLPKQP